MQRQSESDRDLNQLFGQVHQYIYVLHRKIQADTSTQPTDGSTGKTLKKLGGSITNAEKYSRYLLEAQRKKHKQTNDQLSKSMKEVRLLLKRVGSLQQESMLIRKKLNSKEEEVENLKNLNKIDVSYISSIGMRNSDHSDEQVTPPFTECSESVDSVSGQCQLSAYHSSCGCISQESIPGQTRHCLSEDDVTQEVQQLLKQLEIKAKSGFEQTKIIKGHN